MHAIQITQQFGQIGMHITPPDLALQIKSPDAVIKTTPPDLDLAITPPEVIIDLRPCFNTMGLADIGYLEEQFIADAQRTAGQGIERRVAEGAELANPHGPSIGAIADAASKPPEKQLVIGLVPAVPPRVTARGGSVKGFYRPGTVEVRLIRGEINGDFRWGRVDVYVYMEKEPYIDISV